MRTYIISKAEHDTVSSLTIRIASLDLDLGEAAPVQPVCARELSAGWVGAEWVRYVADYQDHPSVGYASLEDLSRHHEWTSDVAPDWQPLVTLQHALAAVTEEGLGPEADELDVEAYRAALTRAWPGASLAPDEAKVLGDAVMEGRQGRDEQGHDWVQVATARRDAAPTEGQEETGYTLRYTDGSGVVTDLEAEDDEAALEAAEEDIRTGDWDTSGGTIWVSGEVYKDGALVDSVRVTIEPDPPECAEGHKHDWVAAQWLVGGISENPGVWGHGGGVISTEACRHCGCKRATDTWAQNPETGEQGLTSVSYEAGHFADALQERGRKEADGGEVLSEADALSEASEHGVQWREAYLERMAERRAEERSATA